MASEHSRLEINWTRALGSALGAVSAAVLLSTLGAAGTIIGAALGSLCITVGGTVYAHSLERTRKHVTDAQVAVARHRNRARNGASVAAGGRSASPAEEFAGTAEEDIPASARSWGQAFRDLPWKRITVTTMALFAVAMAMIVAFELSTGRAVSSYTGGSSGTGSGTSIPGFSGRGDDSVDTGTDGQEQEDQAPQEQDDQAPQEEEPGEEQAPQDGEVPGPGDDEPAVPEPAPEGPQQDPGQ